MGLFDKIKKKESEEVQTPQVEETVENVAQVASEPIQPVEGNQAVVTEVSVDNNPFVEEVTPVEEVVQTSEENPTPSFDNIFNATPGDLVMPTQEVEQAVVQTESTAVTSEVAQEATPVEQPVEAVESVQNIEQSIEQATTSTTFEDEENKADEITQLVSEAVAVNETIQGPTFDQPVVEEISSTPTENQVVEQNIQTDVINNQVVVPEETPIEEVSAEPDLSLINEGMADLAPVEIIPEVEAPTSEAPEETIKLTLPSENDEITLTSNPETQDLDNTENENNEVIISEQPEIVATPEEQPTEPEVIMMDEPIENLEELEPAEIVEQPESASDPQEQPLEEQQIELTSELVNKEVVEIVPEQAIETTEVTNPEETTEVVPTEEVPVEIVPTEESSSDATVTEVNTIENSPVIEEVSTEIHQETNENIEENNEIQDISEQEAFIPDEIAANQNDIIELTSEPAITEEESGVIELTNEPVAELTTEPDLTQLVPEEDENIEAVITPIIPENSTEITSEEVTVPEIEETQTEENVEEVPVAEEQEEQVNEASEESSYYSDITINQDINSENDSQEISPIIESEEPVIELNTIEETEEKSEEDKPLPIIIEEEQVLNLGEENNEETAENEDIKPIIEEENADIQIASDDAANVEEAEESPEENEEPVTLLSNENAEENEEPVILLSNENTEEPQISPFDQPEFEMPKVEEVPEEVAPVEENEVNEEAEAVEDISVPEFDFQSFMMTNNNEENGTDFENGAVVETQTETATYISDPTPTKFCSNCGVMLTDESSICPSCGEPID